MRSKACGKYSNSQSAEREKLKHRDTELGRELEKGAGEGR